MSLDTELAEALAIQRADPEAVAAKQAAQEILTGDPTARIELVLTLTMAFTDDAAQCRKHFNMTFNEFLVAVRMLECTGRTMFAAEKNASAPAPTQGMGVA